MFEEPKVPSGVMNREGPQVLASHHSPTNGKLPEELSDDISNFKQSHVLSSSIQLLGHCSIAIKVEVNVIPSVLVSTDSPGTIL